MSTNQLLSPDWAPLWAALAALAAIVTALVSSVYTYLTLRLVRAQSEPKVIVYVKHDFERPTILMLVVENIGRDIATDVTFLPSRPIPEKAFGISPSDAQEAHFLRDGPFISGIPALGPGDFRSITWGQYGGLSKALGSEPITLNYTYRHGRRRLSGEAKLEVLSYLGTDASEPPAITAARSLKEIENSLKQIPISLNKIDKSLNNLVLGIEALLELKQELPHSDDEE